jgi:cation:H+ antiporter
MDLVVLAFGLIVIFAGAELFTNGIEWFGRKLMLAEGAVGSVLAAVGTALPETMIPLVAIVMAGRSVDASTGHQVGVGAILGAPFMLATLAMFVTGLAVYAARRARRQDIVMSIDAHVLGTDLRFFTLAYGLALAAALLPIDLDWLRYAVVAALVGIYVYYVRRHLKAEPPDEQQDLAPLRLHRVDRPGFRVNSAVPRLRIVSVQVAVAMILIVGGAAIFVGGVEHLSVSLGVAPVLIALVIAPIATELPEKFNSIIWVRRGKDTLALGNITGAMVFQSCFPTTVALLLAPGAWSIGPHSLLPFASAAIAFASVAAIFLPMARRGRLTANGLLLGGAFYVLYLGLVGGSAAGLY